MCTQNIEREPPSSTHTKSFSGLRNNTMLKRKRKRPNYSQCSGFLPHSFSSPFVPILLFFFCVCMLSWFPYQFFFNISSSSYKCGKDNLSKSQRFRDERECYGLYGPSLRELIFGRQLYRSILCNLLYHLTEKLPLFSRFW